MPFVSIITPTFNRKILLEKAILSVINQDQTLSFNWEMIIIDDGSSDNSEEYINSYIKKYPNIHYKYIKNVGMNTARNIGFNMMSRDSDYTILLDSDDELIGDCIKTCLWKFDEIKRKWDYDDYLWLFFFAEDEDKNIIGNKSILQNRKSFDIDYDSYLAWFLTFEPGFIFKSDFFLSKDNRFDPDIPSGGTWVLWAKWWKKEMGENKKKFLFFDYIGRMYRQNNTGRLTFEFTKNKKRFWENATSGDRVLTIVKQDMLDKWLQKIYGDTLFKIGINYLLGWESLLGKEKIKNSLTYKKSLPQILIFMTAYIYPSFIYVLYKIYARLEYTFFKK